MKEYFGPSATLYQQTGGKQNLLIPALMRYIPTTKRKDAKLIDIACGNADFNPLVCEKGYAYFGVDISEDMINRAKGDYPNGNYIVASATQFSRKVNESFDIVLISMLFPALSKKEDIITILKESKKVLKKGGKVLIGVSHPLFDCYMRKGLFNVDFVETDFSGYFTSGKNFLIHKQFDNGVMTFEDYHWLLSDYVECINKSGFYITTIDECEPVGGDMEFMKEKKRFPTYMVFVCKV